MAKRRKSKLYVSRGGDKLHGALSALGLDVAGLTAVDFGANVGGFTDCLLRHGLRCVGVEAEEKSKGDRGGTDKWTLLCAA